VPVKIYHLVSSDHIIWLRPVEKLPPYTKKLLCDLHFGNEPLW